MRMAVSDEMSGRPEFNERHIHMPPSPRGRSRRPRVRNGTAPGSGSRLQTSVRFVQHRAAEFLFTFPADPARRVFIQQLVTDRSATPDALAVHSLIQPFKGTAQFFHTSIALEGQQRVKLVQRELPVCKDLPRQIEPVRLLQMFEQRAENSTASFLLFRVHRHLLRPSNGRSDSRNRFQRTQVKLQTCSNGQGTKRTTKVNTDISFMPENRPSGHYHVISLGLIC